jgi:hypothetical protein
MSSKLVGLLQVKLANKTPATRFATRITFFENKLRKLKRIKHNSSSLLKKCFTKTVNTGVSNKHFNATPVVVADYLYNYTPYNLIFLVKNIYNQEYT